jgi:RES domain-containing protein
MLLWRISNHADLTGMGGELGNGRWHSAAQAKRIVYLAEHPAVALIENLANLRGDVRFFQQHFQLLKIRAPDTVAVKELSSRQLSSVDAGNLASSQSIGDAWLDAKDSALLHVPSIPSPESWNYLLNPLHSEAARLKIDSARTIAYDKRIFRLAGGRL